VLAEMERWEIRAAESTRALGWRKSGCCWGGGRRPVQPHLGKKPYIRRNWQAVARIDAAAEACLAELSWACLQELDIPVQEC